MNNKNEKFHINFIRLVFQIDIEFYIKMMIYL
jgi:hypothetical protein